MMKATYRAIMLACAVSTSLIISTCGSNEGAPPTPTVIYIEPTVETSSPPQATETATTPPPANTVTPELRTTLTPDGPWLVFRTKMGLFAANDDGSALTELLGKPESESPLDLPYAVAPRGGLVAAIQIEQGLKHTLHLIRLPSGEDQMVGVLDPNAPYSAPGERDTAVEAIAFHDSLAWSPDGSMLAFIAAIGGPTADVYTYRVADGTITQLTSGESQAYQLSWSPDSQTILHAGVGSFGTGAGYSMDGVWAARADGSEVKTLYVPSSGDERFDGWLSPTNFLVHSWHISCGANNLRTFDMTTGEEQSLTEFFDEPGPAIDRSTGNVVISADEYVSTCNSDQAIGTFFFNLNNPKLVQVSNEAAHFLIFVPQVHAFYGVTKRGLLEISADGIAADVASPIASVPIISPDGRAWAWASPGFGIELPGLWIGPFHGVATQLTDEPVSASVWSPDSGYLLYFTEQGMYRVKPDGSETTRVWNGLLDIVDERALAWAYP